MSLEERFGTAKPVIAMVHFPGLPGRPRHDRDAGRNRLLDVGGRDLAVLQEAGVDAVLFCNEADIPYQLAVGPEIPAAMGAVIGELHPSITVPFGVNVLWESAGQPRCGPGHRSGLHPGGPDRRLRERHGPDRALAR